MTEPISPAWSLELTKHGKVLYCGDGSWNGDPSSIPPREFSLVRGKQDERSG